MKKIHPKLDKHLENCFYSSLALFPFSHSYKFEFDTMLLRPLIYNLDETHQKIYLFFENQTKLMNGWDSEIKPKTSIKHSARFKFCSFVLHERYFKPFKLPVILHLISFISEKEKNLIFVFFSMQINLCAICSELNRINSFLFRFIVFCTWNTDGSMHKCDTCLLTSHHFAIRNHPCENKTTKCIVEIQ